MSDAEYLNAAEVLLTRNLDEGRGERIAVIDRDGMHTFAALADRSARFARALLTAGIEPEQRVLLALEDTVAFHVCFLGALRAGVVPVPLNTLFTAADYAFIDEDSRARAIVASPSLMARMPELGGRPGFTTGTASGGYLGLRAVLDGVGDDGPVPPTPYRTRAHDVAFWLYTSGTTGRPKGVMHSHTNLLATAATYGADVLALGPDDVVFSAAKLFFAYGLGNGLTFPLAAGATAVLHDGAPTPEAVARLIDLHRPTVFFGVPTLYAMLLNTGHAPAAGHRLRLCVSAGEALPRTILERWREATGATILDGIGSTEMLHIFMSNRAGSVEPGSSGVPVDGYEAKLMSEAGDPAADGEMGDLHVRGPSMCHGYWNRHELNLATFSGHWMRTGDKYLRSPTGAFVHCGRSDDLLKVGGIWVAPIEVENALLEHAAVAEAAVVGCEDADRLVKPKAFVVPVAGVAGDATLAHALIEHVAGRLSPYKRPRWVEFVTELPKTATGKIQRFKLR